MITRSAAGRYFGPVTPEERRARIGHAPFVIWLQGGDRTSAVALERQLFDLGYLVTVPLDATVTLSAERHEWSLKNNRGYCRQRSTRELLEEIGRLTGT